MKLPKNIWHWAFYDFANSSYVLIYQAFLLPLFFSTILISYGYSLSSWGIANGISTVIGVILAVFLGKYCDKHNRLQVFKWIILICFFSMVLMSLSINKFTPLVFYFYILTNSIFIASLSISDSILPHISDKKNVQEYSGFAWGFGYLGGMLSLILVVILQKIFSEYSSLVFLSVAIFYLLFSLYALKGLKTTSLNKKEGLNKEILSNKNKGLLLIGYWLISEAITVIILFFSIFASKELGFSTLKIGLSLLFVQLIGFPATWFGGKLTRKYSEIFLLGITIIFWGIIILIMITNPNMFAFGFVILLAGLSIGNSQSLIRAQYSALIDKSESGYQFGIYSFISQAAVSIGPILYGISSDYLNSQKIPLVILFVLMVIGFMVIRHVIKQVNFETNPHSLQ